MTNSERSPCRSSTNRKDSSGLASQLMVAVQPALQATGSTLTTGSTGTSQPTPSVPASLAATQGWVRSGTSLIGELLVGTPTTVLQGKSRLEGWSRAHVVAHLARNADALCNLLTWAKTGIRTPMYSDLQARGSDIAQSAAMPPQTLLDDFAETARRLRAQIDELSPQDWNQPVESALGRSILASEVLWLRTREIWLHAFDLDLGMTLEDLPIILTKAFISDIVQNLSSKEGCPTAHLHAGGSAWSLGPELLPSSSPQSGSDQSAGSPDGQRLVICGEPAALLGWISGRIPSPNSSEAGLPAIPPWL